MGKFFSKRFVISFILIFICTISFGQVAMFSILNPDTINHQCNTNCDTIKTQFNNTSTLNYTFSAGTYAPVNFTGVSVMQYQDSFSGAIPIGFAFCFYGNTYTQCYISDNGMLTFNPFYNLASCNSSAQNALPYFNNTFPNNAICMPACDLDPTQGGTTKYTTLGVAPNRKFVLDYSNYQLYGSTCTNAKNSFQLILYEATNNIEFHITKKHTCDNSLTALSNYAVLGMQNSTTLLHHTLPIYNATIWADSNKCFIAKPNGIDTTTIFNWYENGTLVSSGNKNKTFAACTTLNAVYPKRIVCKAIMQCPQITYQDSVLILAAQPPIIDSVQLVKPLCTSSNTGSITIFSHSTTGIPYTVNNLNGNAIVVLNNLMHGAFNIVAKDINFCFSDTTIDLPPIVAPPIINPKNAICPDSNGSVVIIPNPIALPYTVLWSTGDTGLSLNNLKAGNYSVSITDSFGCIYQETFEIKYDSLPYIKSYLATASLCTPTGTATIVVAGGTPPYTYAWLNNSSTSTIIINASAGVHFVSITDANNCVGAGAVNIPDTVQTTISVTGVNTKCDSANGSAVVTVLTGIPPFTYLWSNGSTTNTISNVPAGIYSVIVTSQVTNCYRTKLITILPSPKFQLFASVGNQNCDTSNGTILTNLINANPPINYLWSNGTTDSNANYLLAGTYSVTVKDGIGCHTKKNIVVGNDGSPHLKIVSYTPPLCFGDSNGSVTLTGFLGNPPYKYSLTGTNFTTNNTIGDAWGGNYPIYITDANSCNRDTLVNFPQPALLVLQPLVDAVICKGDSNGAITLSGSGGTPTYLYKFNNTIFNTTTNFINLPAGNYPVITIDKNGCTDSTTVIVASPDSLRLAIDTKVIDCFAPNSGTAHVTLSGGWTPYFVKNGSEVPAQFDTLPLPVNQRLVLAYADAKGCNVSQQIIVSQNYDCCKINIPNVFTPNDDLMNDVFKLITPIHTSDYQFSIYNRWGKLVYQTTDNTQGWNGRYNNRACEGAVYFYFIKYTCANTNEQLIEKGDVLLLY